MAPMRFETNRRLAKDFNNQFQTVQYGDKTCKFRSKLEKKVADYLEMLKIGNYIKDWEYESHKFLFPDDKWLVDFTIRNNYDSFEYFEAKGLFDARARRYVKLLAKYRPEVKMTIVFGRKSDTKKMSVSKKYVHAVCYIGKNGLTYIYEKNNPK